MTPFDSWLSLLSLAQTRDPFLSQGASTTMPSLTYRRCLRD